MKVVLDTNVLVRAYPGAQGPARRILTYLLSSDSDRLVVSSHILEEVERVLRLPRMTKRNRLGPSEIAAFLNDLDAGGDKVTPAEVPLDLLQDSDDLPVLGTAVASAAQVLCTRDLGFYEESVRGFCAERSLEVLSDLELLARLK